MLKIVHIINPVSVSRNSSLFIAQPVTFESIRVAKRIVGDAASIDLVAVSYPEDNEMLPEGFIHIPTLAQSVLDFINPVKPRKLPLISEILDKASAAISADYLIYSNVDIAVMPYFYSFINKAINQGYDAFVINRRTIGNYTSVTELNEMYADPGEKHPGFDCFVFKREHYRHYCLGTACIGANWIGRVMISNLIAWSSKFRIFENHHLTFHIGDDRSWKKPENYDYDRHNEKELEKTLLFIKNKGRLGKNELMKGFLTQVEKMNYKIPLYSNYRLPENPVFIIGFTRSGTTLLQTLLATQKNVISFPETHFFCEYTFNYLRFDSNNNILPESLEMFFSKTREYSGLDIEWFEIDYFKHLAGTGRLNAVTLFESIVKHYLVKQINPMQFDDMIWLEKTPFHAHVIERILRFYPKVRFISIVRHPLPAIYSTQKNIHPGESLEFIAQKYQRTQHSIAEALKKYPDKIFPIRFEDLTSNVEATIAGICRFLNIGFEPDKLGDFHKKAVHAVKPFEKWKNMVFKPKIDSSDNNEFLESLPLIEILKLQHLLKNEMQSNFYPVFHPEKQILFEKLIS